MSKYILNMLIIDDNGSLDGTVCLRKVIT